MSPSKHRPGVVRDAIIDYLGTRQGDASVAEITGGVESRIGTVPASSVRSYLRLRSDQFRRTRHGRYELKSRIGRQ